MNNIISCLFKTNAIKICPDNKPFWYTSGKIGPYYINTHFLYGSEQEAIELLSFIDLEKSDKSSFPEKIYKKTFNHYNENHIYRTVINEMCDFIKQNINIEDIDYISGGERRDWFFSNIISYFLNKPHITIYKDLSIVISNSNFNKKIENYNLNGAKVLHIADLITEASSYIRAWIPAINSLGARIAFSTVVVDRMQGGEEKLIDKNIKSFSIVSINPDLFKEALNIGVINSTQFNMLNDFYKNPDKTMELFLKEHPEFLKNSLSSDEKTASRAKLCIENNFYNINL